MSLSKKPRQTPGASGTGPDDGVDSTTTGLMKQKTPGERRGRQQPSDAGAAIRKKIFQLTGNCPALPALVSGAGQPSGDGSFCLKSTGSCPATPVRISSATYWRRRTKFCQNYWRLSGEYCSCPRRQPRLQIYYGGCSIMKIAAACHPRRCGCGSAALHPPLIQNAAEIACIVNHT